MNNQNLFPKRRTTIYQILGNEALITAGYKVIGMSIFHQLAVKLWLKEYTNDL